MASVAAALDDLAFARRFASWLTAAHGVEVVVDEVEHPSVGYSSVTTMVRARWEYDGHAEEAHLVVRMPPSPAGTFADYDLSVQHAAQLAAAAGGVPVAAPLQTEAAPVWLGAPFTVMPRVAGHIIGEAHPFDPCLAGRGLVDQCNWHDHPLGTRSASP